MSRWMSVPSRICICSVVSGSDATTDEVWISPESLRPLFAGAATGGGLPEFPIAAGGRVGLALEKVGMIDEEEVRVGERDGRRRAGPRQDELRLAKRAAHRHLA